jgi:uncharacterized protein
MVRIVWDEPKRLANLDRHGLDFRTVTLAFFVSALVRPTREDRRQAIGYLDGRAVSLVYKPLGAEALSLISLRPASSKEKGLL